MVPLYSSIADNLVTKLKVDSRGYIYLRLGMHNRDQPNNWNNENFEQFKKLFRF